VGADADGGPSIVDDHPSTTGDRSSTADDRSSAIAEAPSATDDHPPAPDERPSLADGGKERPECSPQRHRVTEKVVWKRPNRSVFLCASAPLW
jgi:hypothetical protein